MPRLKQTRNELAEKVWGVASVQGVTNTKMAEIIGVSPNTLVRIKQNPTHYFDAVLRIGRYLQIPIDEIRECVTYPY